MEDIQAHSRLHLVWSLPLVIQILPLRPDLATEQIRTLLKGPITPFTVTFCHIIAHPLATSADLALLAEFVATLKDLRRFSEGMVKLYRLCDIFCNVANLYVQAKEKESRSFNATTQPGITIVDSSAEWIGQPAVNDIDEYLATMGFAPPPASAANVVPNPMDSNLDLDASFLMDWYQGNSSLMGFLEQDLSYPGESGDGYMPDFAG